MRMTPAESHYVLQSLLSQGRIRVNQVKAVLNGRSKVIAELRERLASLEGIGGAGTRRRGRKPSASTKRSTQKRRVAISPKVRALRRLQGKYMGTMRGLNPSKRAVIKKIRATKGIRAAISAAQRMAG